MFAQVRKLFFMIEYKVTCAHYRFSQVFALFASRLKTVGYFLLAFKYLFDMFVCAKGIPLAIYGFDFRGTLTL